MFLIHPAHTVNVNYYSVGRSPTVPVSVPGDVPRVRHRRAEEVLGAGGGAQAALRVVAVDQAVWEAQSKICSYSDAKIRIFETWVLNWVLFACRCRRRPCLGSRSPCGTGSRRRRSPGRSGSSRDQ